MKASRSSEAVLPYAQHDNGHRPRTFTAALHKRWTLLRTLCAVVLATYLLSQTFVAWVVVTDHTTKRHPPGLPLKSIPKHLKDFQTCSIHNFLATNLTFMDTAQPLPVSEFVTRRDRLAQGLVHEDVDAFVVEPGYTFSYYGNVTQTDWEVWEPEERPFLMVVLPTRSPDGRDVKAETWFLVPSFEAERARLLGMPFPDDLALIEYEEHWDPYQTLLESRPFSLIASSHRKPRIMVDEEIRDFISRGLADHGFDVRGLGGAVEEVRQRKSRAEIGILRAVNTGTVEAVRAMRRCLDPGLTEEEVMLVLDNTMRAGGLDPFFDIVLFDEDASNPHGGTDGLKVLEKETMVLIDVGAHLYGYSSDICRSFFPPFFTQPEDQTAWHSLSDGVQEKLKVWDVVFEAQTASLAALEENSTAAAVDIAARTLIEEAGYGKAFTHRVGHGIGIKAHESPYLNKGNVNATLRAGMTFTSEPGVYLVDKFGVRHEDVLLVREDGLPELLTGRRATSAWEP
ncbi:putative peptidase [Teratosphaeria destructans]|uniref:Peptidase n=1 Tax=Teratosphaeria destructans TaxID=418781 RepID=A0A9W7SYW2_9PEZI|nr:putative peptidase [Teratosphaeria destructans]